MRNRNNRIVFYLNDSELKRLNSNVKKCGMSREAYLRKVISGVTPKELPTIDYISIVYELSKIGTNIHQIAIKAHKFNFIDAPLYDETYEQLQDTLGKIMSALY